MRPQAVIFDLFGTLVSWPATSSGRHAALAASVGVPLARFRERWADLHRRRDLGELDVEAALRLIAGEAGGRPTDVAFARAVTAELAFLRDVLRPKRGVSRLLADLRTSGLRVGLLSDCPVEVVRLWGETSLAAGIDECAFSCVEGACKPDPRLFATICRRLAADPADCLYVGNGDGDELAAARRAGMLPVLFRPPQQPVVQYAAAWRGMKVRSFAELAVIVRKMW